jgi:hypothetical protein
MEITIIINTDNAAFEDENEGAEVARILRRLAREIYGGVNLVPGCDPLRDINGNQCGKVVVKE